MTSDRQVGPPNASTLHFPKKEKLRQNRSAVQRHAIGYCRNFDPRLERDASLETDARPGSRLASKRRPANGECAGFVTVLDKPP